MSSDFISSTLLGTGRVCGAAAAAAAGGGAGFLGTAGTALVTLGRPPAARATGGAEEATLDADAVFFISGRVGQSRLRHKDDVTTAALPITSRAYELSNGGGATTAAVTVTCYPLL